MWVNVGWDDSSYAERPVALDDANWTVTKSEPSLGFNLYCRLHGCLLMKESRINLQSRSDRSLEIKGLTGGKWCQSPQQWLLFILTVPNTMASSYWWRQWVYWRRALKSRTVRRKRNWDSTWGQNSDLKSAEILDAFKLPFPSCNNVTLVLQRVKTPDI